VANLVGAAVDRHLAAAELERMSLYDGLTGLPNRTLLMDRLTQALRRTRGAPGRVAVIFLDLDRLKLVNDALGHVAGDELLAAFARRLSEAVRAGDTAGRLGGDEFVVVCEDLSGDVAAATATSLDLAERLNHAVSGHYRLADGGVYVTPSIGVAVNARGDDAQSILHNADAAMYRAKHRGRGSIDAYDEGMRREATRRRELLEALRLAEHNDELFLLWQPVMALATGRVLAIEASLRWRHPSLGVLGPEHFLGHAEETGLIVPVGDWVLRRACAEAATLPRDGADPPPALAVNVSRRQLLQAELLDVVDDALQRSALPPEQLILEVAESAICRDPARVARMLAELRTRGVRVAVDDVGTGDASLRRLSTVPCDLWKIDRAVLSDAAGGGHERALLAGVIGAAEALELGCVGEGVETPLELETLRELGCAAGQGRFWSPPLTMGELAGWLAERERAATD
jgi:diguanylate cyclase (GGDEF)-like protein